MALPSLTDLKTHLNMTSTKDDDELADVLDAAVEIVADLIGPIDSPTTVTETHYGVSTDALVLRRMPVAALTSLSIATGTALTVGDFVLDPAAGVVRTLDGSRFRGSFTVTYTAGRDSLPAAVRLGVLIVAGHLWETQRGTAPTPLAVDDTFATPGLGFAIPNRAKELLAPYIRPSVA